MTEGVKPNAHEAGGAVGHHLTPDIAYPANLSVEPEPYPQRVMREQVDVFFKKEFLDLEVEHIFKKTWQMACREEHIPEVGDHIVYEVADLLFIVVRTGPEEIKAYWNVCPHRSRKLADCDGKRAREFRCMFHGWAWNIDGSMKDMTCGWDFPGTRDEVSHLPECKVGTWGGFVFINPDENAQPLADFLGEMPKHYEGAGHDLRKRWVQAHVQVELPVNWKLVQDAFFEAWHSATTHPQIVRTKVDMFNSGNRWDNFENWMRLAPALPTDRHKSPPGASIMAETPQQVIDFYYEQHLDEEPRVAAEPGRTADEVINRNTRAYFHHLLGEAAEAYHTAHMRGGDMTSVWPNFHPWGNFARIVYRFRPLGGNPEESIMDVLLLSPLPDEIPRPPPAPIHRLKIGEPVTNAAELGYLARIFCQDLGNLPSVQAGVKTSKSGYIILSQHNEAPLRKFYDKYNSALGLKEVEK